MGPFDLDSQRREVPRPGRVAALAEGQHGVVARWQLVELGVGVSGIDYQLGTGRLHSLHPGVYAVGHTVLSRSGRVMAAVLSCGPDAVASHRDAAAIHGIRRSSRWPVDVTVTGRSRHRRVGVHVHRVRSLDPRDVTTSDGIPVTTLARTLLDLAEVVPPHQLERAIEEAERLGLFDLTAAREVCARSPGRHGLRPLQAALRKNWEPILFTRSELERRFLTLVRQAGLPEPAMNAWVRGMEVDALWHEQQLIVELDTIGTHGTAAAFEPDRERDAELQLAGYRVPRITDRRIARDPNGVVHTLRRAFDRDSARDA